MSAGGPPRVRSSVPLFSCGMLHPSLHDKERRIVYVVVEVFCPGASSLV